MLKPFLFILSFFTAAVINAQISDAASLFKSLQERDSLVFEEGFNKCNISVYDSIIFGDLEFYHDKGGVTKGKTAFIASVRNNICGSKNKVKRNLDKSSIQVYPLYNNQVLYGAVQQGIHTFYILENSKWKAGSTAKFTHLWLIENGQLKLKRVLSYSHE